jgi:hypothetical protein
MSVTTKRVHMSLSVEGAMHWPARLRKDLLQDEDGRALSAAETLKTLRGLFAEGVRYLPIGNCDNFDDQQGCLGHPAEEGTRG